MVDVYEQQEALYEERKAICESCPLYKKVGDRVICNPNLYLNFCHVDSFLYINSESIICCKISVAATPSSSSAV